MISRGPHIPPRARHLLLEVPLTPHDAPARRESLLYDLLMARFGTEQAAREELRRALRGWPGCQDLETVLPTALTSPAHQVQALVDALAARAIPDRAFFAQIERDRVGSQAQVRELAGAWGVTLGAPLPPHRAPASLPPGTAFHPEHYISWGRPERRALRQLRHPGAPVVVCGPPRVGKTWLLQWLLAELRAQGVRVHTLNLDDTTAADRQDYAAFLRWFTAALLPERSSDEIAALWAGAVNLNIRFSEVLKTQVLRDEGATVALAIDRADRIRLQPYNDDFYGMLRARARDGASAPWDRLRLLIALSGSPHEMAGDPNSSVFYGLSHPESLLGFEKEQVLSLMEQYALPSGSVTVEELMGLPDRRPFRLREALFERTLDEADDAP